jgi:hypothetical protein
MKYLLLLICFFSITQLFAQQKKGDLSLQFSGNYYSQRYTIRNDVTKFGFGTIYVKMGKYFTPNLELGVKPNVNFLLFTETTPATDTEPKKRETVFTTNVGFGLYGTYSFLTKDGKFLPYLGAELNYAPVNNEATINLGPYAGAKYFVTERINIDANLSFLLNLGSTVEEPRGDYEVGPLFTYNIGIGVLLGKLKD